MPRVRVIGGGLAGVEAAHFLARGRSACRPVRDAPAEHDPCAQDRSAGRARVQQFIQGH
ncbi:MAG: hypothetical protein MZV64_31740 [Ignavibacteriales bacterium]|nr:hypothetical protein [Ignavibacteriales bacterium]